MRIKYATSKTSFVFIPLFLQSWNLKNSKCCEIQKKKEKRKWQVDNGITVKCLWLSVELLNEAKLHFNDANFQWLEKMWK